MALLLVLALCACSSSGVPQAAPPANQRAAPAYPERGGRAPDCIAEVTGIEFGGGLYVDSEGIARRPGPDTTTGDIGVIITQYKVRIDALVDGRVAGLEVGDEVLVYTHGGELDMHPDSKGAGGSIADNPFSPFAIGLRPGYTWRVPLIRVFEGTDSEGYFIGTPPGFSHRINAEPPQRLR